MNSINVLQFICPTGLYGAERWILALFNNLDKGLVRTALAVTRDNSSQLEISNLFSSLGGRVFELNMNSRFSISVLRDLCRLIREREINIIHTHGYKSDILGLIAAKLTGIKILSTPHGFGSPTDLKLKTYIQLGKFSLKFFDHVAPLSRQLAQELQMAKIPDVKVTYIQNAIDLREIDLIKHKRPGPRNPSQYKIGYIGRMVPGKNIDHILDIFNQIWQENNNIELILLGDGDSRIALESNAKSMPCAENINFLGFRSDRLKLLSQFDLFVLTSSNEGIPRCLMEAIAMGIPVAAYNIPGVAQLVVHRRTGLLADYGDKDKLKIYWNKLLGDKDYAKDLASKGRQLIKDKFSGQRMADEYTSLYKKMLSQSKI